MVQVWMAHVVLLLLFCQGVGDSFLNNNWGRGGHYAYNYYFWNTYQECNVFSNFIKL
jgi:hypothetical protein